MKKKRRKEIENKGEKEEEEEQEEQEEENAGKVRRTGQALIIERREKRTVMYLEERYLCQNEKKRKKDENCQSEILVPVFFSAHIPLFHAEEKVSSAYLVSAYRIFSYYEGLFFPTQLRARYVQGISFCFSSF